GILAASEQLPRTALAGHEFIGELGLAGELRAVDGVLPAALACGEAGRVLVVPAANGAEAALGRDVDVRVARTLSEGCAHVSGQRPLPRAVAEREAAGPPAGTPDLADVRGQLAPRRALEIAAA